MVLHAFINYFERNYAETACGQRGRADELNGIDTAGDVLNDVTCKKCVKKFAASMISVNAWSRDSLWHSLIQAEQSKAVAASQDVLHARVNLLSHVDEVLRLIESAKRDVLQERRRIEQFDGTCLMSAVDYASSITRCPAFIGSNLNVSGLMRYAVDLDRAIEGAKKETV